VRTVPVALRTLALCVSLSVLVPACFFGDPVAQNIAMQRDDLGRAVIIGTVCGAEGFVVSVFLKTTEVNRPLLWQATSDTATGPIAIPVGGSAPGFDVTVPLAEPLAPNTEYVASVESSLRTGDNMFFTPASLPTKPDILLVRGDIVPAQGYIDDRTDGWCQQTFPEFTSQFG
jgi:hypothetical protein